MSEGRGATAALPASFHSRRAYIIIFQPVNISGPSHDHRRGRGLGQGAQGALGPQNPLHAKGPTFADLAAIYIKERRLAPYAGQCLLYRMGNFMPVFGHRQALRILHQDLAAYVDKRRRDGVRDSTIRREGNDIKAIFAHAVKRRPPLIPHSPARRKMAKGR